MKFHSELASVIDSIQEVRVALKDLVISLERPTDDNPWYQDGWKWERMGDGLHRALRDAVDNNDELKEVLYRRGLGKLGVVDRLQAGQEQQPPELMHPQVQMARDFIKRNGPVTGEAVAEHIGVKYRSFMRHYAEPLRVLGMKNDRRGNGYYFPEG
jgi:hypothetical protein